VNTTLPSSAVIVPFRQPRKGERFVLLRESLLASTNYQSLPPPQVSLLIEFARRFNGFNNGNIRISIDEAKTVAHSGQAVATRAFEGLEVHGFIRRLQHGTFDFQSKADRDSRWELTEFTLGTQMSTNATSPSSKTGTNTASLVPVASTNIRIDSIDSKKEEESSESLPRKEGQSASKPSEVPFSFPALLKAMNGAATGGRDGGAYLHHPDAMAALAAFERARGQPFPRDGRGGCQLSRKDFGAFNQWIASWMRPKGAAP
jgi:hypothetical protein